MKLSLRFILPLAAVLSLMAYGIIPLVDSLTMKWFVKDLSRRSEQIAESRHDELIRVLQNPIHERSDFFHALVRDERLYAVGFCGPDQKLKIRTDAFPEIAICGEANSPEVQSQVVSLPSGPLLLVSLDVSDKGRSYGTVVLAHDMSYVGSFSSDTKKYIFIFFVAVAFVVSLVTVIVAQVSWRGWVSGIRNLLRGEGFLKPLAVIENRELLPIVKDLRTLVKDLDATRRGRDETQLSWTPKTLRNLLRDELAGDEIIIVSNREPYVHTRNGDKIEAHVPASGLVTALEPVMRACSGTWIAFGSGNADREVVDEKDHVRVPPENPTYQIRRVWLTPEEEQGFYYGFANEGIWPLCHAAHIRPTFRTEDWKQYVYVNEKFATAVFEEVHTDDPVILVQDYHFALLPRMIRRELPNSTVITFWHIPWPNAEAFGICPWRAEILDGLLGSSILGFHTRFHCNNFVDSIDRYLEARIDRETSVISYGGKLTAVESYPISIEWPPKQARTFKSIADSRKLIRDREQLPEDHFIAIGVDRLDYTKGIEERFLAVERLLENYPDWEGKFSLIQIAAPSRSVLESYRALDRRVRDLADRINGRFGTDKFKPIYLKIEHHDADQIVDYYRGAEVCIVTSLHDGMNLVAKEFVSTRDDEKGVLILSQFTGAARELPEALIVNPYNIDQCAQAIHSALSMSPAEQRDRMRSMRGLLQEFNVYRWAGRMLVDAGRMRRKNRLRRRIGEFDLTKPPEVMGP